MKCYVGIDLGTTCSTVSVISMENDNSNPIASLQQLPIYQYDEHFNPLLNDIRLPSFLYADIDHHLIYTGHYAKEIFSTGNRPMQTVHGIKMRLGNDSIVQIPSIEEPAYTETFTMQQCSALYLKTIRQSLRKQLQEDIVEAVITIPTAFSAEERIATINAAKIAGFHSVSLLDEPTAALNWHVHNEDTGLQEYLKEKPQNILVYDIGGGTLDISIANLQLVNGQLKVKILGCSPRMDLGGNNFDQLLGAYFLYDYERARKDLDERQTEQQHEMIAKLVSQAEKQKILFNNKIRRYLNNPRRKHSEELTASFEVANNQHAYTILNYEILEKVFSSLTDPVGNMTLTSAIEPALRKANLTLQEIDEVVFTGGMSQFYVVEECVKAYFGDYNVRYQFLDHVSAVSKGAAIYQYALNAKQQCFNNVNELIVEDKMAENVYIKIGKQYVEFISHTTPPNSRGMIDYVIEEDGLIEIPLFLYSGYGDNPCEYMRLGGQFIHLKNSMKAGEIIPIQWTIDEHKVVKLSVANLGELYIESSLEELSLEQAVNDPIHVYTINGNLFI